MKQVSALVYDPDNKGIKRVDVYYTVNPVGSDYLYHIEKIVRKDGSEFNLTKLHDWYEKKELDQIIASSSKEQVAFAKNELGINLNKKKREKKSAEQIKEEKKNRELDKVHNDLLSYKPKTYKPKNS